MAEKAGRYLEVAAVVTGTDEDPQNLYSQIEQLKAAGTWVSTSNEEMVRYAGQILRGLNKNGQDAGAQTIKTIDLAVLQNPLEAINVGLESFYENLKVQGVPVIQVDWRPPAGGNEKLMGILARMKK